MLFLSIFLEFASAVLASYILLPLLVGKATELNKQQAQNVVTKVDRYLQDEDLKKAYQLSMFAPFLLAAAGFMLFPEDRRIIGMIAGSVLGYVLPRFYVGRLVRVHKVKFNDQLMDALMIMSSSFRGGLSLIQAFEAVVDEMPEPAKGEFGIVLGENKMGVALDESLNRLYTRMPSPATQQMITAIVLARETGGNLPIIFSRIIGTMRERKKIEQNLQALTIQGKIQSVVMSGLPIFFYIGVSGSNPHFFDTMLNSPTGQKLLFTAVVLWILGAFSIWKISSFKDI